MKPPIRMHALAAAAFLAATPLAAAESVKFTFAPPAAAFVERESRAIEIRLGGNRDRHTTASLSTIQIRREAGAVYVTRRYDEIAGAKEGEEFTTPPQIAAMKGSKIVHVLGPDGAMKRVDGYSQIVAKALPLMTGEAKKSLQKLVDEGRQDAEDRAGWHSIEMLIDQTLELDRDYWFESAWSDESGWALFHTLVRLGPWVDDPSAGRLLTVNFAFTRNAPATLPNATKLEPRIATRFVPARVKPVSKALKLEGSASLLMDPATSVIWKTQLFRKISEPMQISGDLGVTIVTEERITKTLERAASAAPAPAKN